MPFEVMQLLKKGNFGFLPAFLRWYLSFSINFLRGMEGQLTHPRELCGIRILFGRNYRKTGKDSIHSKPEDFTCNSFINSVSYLFNNTVRRHADDAKVNKTNMVLAYLELVVWWGRGHKSDRHITGISAAINTMKEKYVGVGYEGI